MQIPVLTVRNNTKKNVLNAAEPPADSFKSIFKIVTTVPSPT